VGTVFTFSPSGTPTTVSAINEAGIPFPMVKGSDGNLYSVRTGTVLASMVFRVDTNQ
jgi:hypothetical protein